MRGAIYTRVSSDPQGKGRSVAEQGAECRAICEREGWEVVQVFSDNDRSASRYAKKQRPAYQQLQAFVSQGHCDVLVTWEASRFQRDLEAYVALRELCRKHKVLWSYSGRTFDLSRTDDRLMTGLDALLAERESDITRERILRAVRANAAAGKPHGKIPYGYSRYYDPTSGVLVSQVIRVDEAQIIQEAGRRVVAGEVPHAIARDFNRREVPTPHNGKWDTTRIRRLVTNPIYIGQRTHRGKVIGEATWPAILDEATFHQCIARFADPERKKFWGGKGFKHLLTYIAKCGVCGADIRAGAPRGLPTYLCGNKFCVARKIEPVDQLITKLVIARLNQPDAASLFVPPDDTAATQTLTEISAKRARLDTFYDAAATGEITAVALARIESRLMTEIEALERKVQHVGVPTAIYDLIGKADTVWPTLELSQRREVIQCLMDIRIKTTVRGRRRFEPERIDISWISAQNRNLNQDVFDGATTIKR